MDIRNSLQQITNEPGEITALVTHDVADTMMTIRALMRREVHRVELASIVSKRDGDLEDRLNVLFAEAASKRWILFFDEADALFGKRSRVQDAHDKYSDSDIQCLLDKIARHSQSVIFALRAEPQDPDSELFRKSKYLGKIDARHREG